MTSGIAQRSIKRFTIIVKSTPTPFYRPITDIVSEVPTDASSASGVALPWRVEISLPWRVV